jgi:PAS domain S-box-containing protein
MTDEQDPQIPGDILIVDDDLPSRQALSTMLADHDYEVRSAPDGPTALMIVEADPPDLVLLDVLMFEMDGYEVCRRLKARPESCDIPVLFVSALGEMVDQIKGFEAGGVDFITKPFRAEEVLARVATHLALRRAQKRLEAQNAELLKLSVAVEQNANAIIITDVQGHIEYANPRFEEITGYAVDEVLGQTPRILKSGTHDEAYYRELWQTIESGKTWRGEFYNKRKDGSLYWEQATITPVCDELGRITNYIAIKEETSKRKRAEQALRESEEKYRLLVENLQEGVWAIDSEARTTFVNRRLVEMLGYAEEDMLGKHLFDFMDERGIEVAEANLERRRAGIRERHDFEFQRCDGTRMYASMETSPITDEQGNYLGALAGVMDISDRRRAEDALKQRVQELAVLNRVAQTVATVVDLPQSLETVVEIVNHLFDARTTAITLWQRDQLEVASCFDREPGGFPLVNQVMEFPRSAALRQPLDKGEAVSFPDIRAIPLPPLLQRYVHAQNLRAALFAPLRTRGAAFGSLVVATDQADRVFSAAEISVAETIATDIAAAVENARLYRQAQELAVAEERNRLAQDLHDSVTQTLYSVALTAEALPRVWERHPNEAQAALRGLLRLSRGALAEMRALLLELRPAMLLEKQLSELLRQLADATMGRTQLLVRVRVESDRTLPDEVHVALFRIAQEALNNVVKHANASQVMIRLDYEPELVVLRIHDDGCGFVSEAVPGQGFGMRNMADRARSIHGEFRIRSQLGSGTQIDVVWREPAGSDELAAGEM